MKIVITGGPGTGKSSIIKKLDNQGYHVFHETSREIIKKYKKLGHDQLFLSNPIKFSEILLKNRIQQFKKSDDIKSDFKFFDRGIPDMRRICSRNVRLGISITVNFNHWF